MHCYSLHRAYDSCAQVKSISFSPLPSSIVEESVDESSDRIMINPEENHPVQTSVSPPEKSTQLEESRSPLVDISTQRATTNDISEYQVSFIFINLVAGQCYHT